MHFSVQEQAESSWQIPSQMLRYHVLELLASFAHSRLPRDRHLGHSLRVHAFKAHLSDRRVQHVPLCERHPQHHTDRHLRDHAFLDHLLLQQEVWPDRQQRICVEVRLRDRQPANGHPMGHILLCLLPDQTCHFHDYDLLVARLLLHLITRQLYPDDGSFHLPGAGQAFWRFAPAKFGGLQWGHLDDFVVFELRMDSRLAGLWGRKE